jgi:magnesium chelatase accessory protein
MQPLTLPPDWPHRSTSRHIASPPHLWHVQIQGSGPDLLLLHGAGGGTHSWRNLIPLLAPHFRTIAIDLPGQGFSRLGTRDRCGLDPMAADIATLCTREKWRPTAIIGHSAGAVIALRLSEVMPLTAVIGINAAIGGFDGVAGWLFPAMAKLLSLTPFAAQMFSRISGTEARAKTLLSSTGSNLDPAGQSQYLTLLRNPGHIDATLAMMAQWRLDDLLARLPALTTPTLLITASGDTTVPPAVSERATKRLARAQWVNLPGHGHLVHEEAASDIAKVLLSFLAAQAEA